MEKFYSSKALLKMAGEEDCIPHIPPVSASGPQTPIGAYFVSQSASNNCSTGTAEKNTLENTISRYATCGSLVFLDY